LFGSHSIMCSGHWPLPISMLTLHLCFLHIHHLPLCSLPGRGSTYIPFPGVVPRPVFQISASCFSISEFLSTSKSNALAWSIGSDIPCSHFSSAQGQFPGIMLAHFFNAFCQFICQVTFTLVHSSTTYGSPTNDSRSAISLLSAVARLIALSNTRTRTIFPSLVSLFKCFNRQA